MPQSLDTPTTDPSDRPVRESDGQSAVPWRGVHGLQGTTKTHLLAPNLSHHFAHSDRPHVSPLDFLVSIDSKAGAK